MTLIDNGQTIERREEQTYPLERDPQRDNGVWRAVAKADCCIILVATEYVEGAANAARQPVLVAYKVHDNRRFERSVLQLPANTTANDVFITDATWQHSIDPEIPRSGRLILSGAHRIAPPKAIKQAHGHTLRGVLVQTATASDETQVAIGGGRCGGCGPEGHLDAWLGAFSAGYEMDGRSLLWRVIGDGADDQFSSLAVNLNGDLFAAGLIDANIGCCDYGDYRSDAYVVRLDRRDQMR